MSKRSIRVAGFVGSAVATVGLVAFAAAGTGAYFSDTEVGSIKGTAGTIQVSAPAQADFQTLLPGDDRTVTTTVTNEGNSAQDIWVKFPAELAAVKDYAKLTVNEKNVIGGGWVKVFGGLPSLETADLNIRLIISGTVGNELLGHTINPETGAGLGTQALNYTVVATQVGQSPA